MIIYSKITAIFCLVDEFCKEYDQIVDKHLLGTPPKRPSVMSKSEVITILFQLSSFRTFKHFKMDNETIKSITGNYHYLNVFYAAFYN